MQQRIFNVWVIGISFLIILSACSDGEEASSADVSEEATAETEETEEETDTAESWSGISVSAVTKSLSANVMETFACAKASISSSVFSSL